MTRAEWRWTLAAVVTAMATLLVVLVPSASSWVSATESYSKPADASYIFSGHGWGHGRGMSQWGAHRAAKLGKSAADIVGFYYSKSRPGTVEDRVVRVLLEATDGDREVRFRQAEGLTASVISGTKTIGTQPLTGRTWWRVLSDQAGLRVQYQTAEKSWTTVKIGGKDAWADGTRMEIKAAKPVTLHEQDGLVRTYRGRLQMSRLSAKALRVVDHVRLESEYLPSVLPSEMSASWPTAALEAQAIAARSFTAWALAHPKTGDYDLCNTQTCQMYRGTVTEHKRANAAIKATRGQIRTTSKGRPLRLEFSASNGGSIATGGPGHSPAKYDAWSDGDWDAHHEWSKKLTPAEIAAKVFGSGAVLQRIDVTERNGHGDWGGRVVDVVFHGTSNGKPASKTLTGERARSKLGLRSSYFTVR